MVKAVSQYLLVSCLMCIDELCMRPYVFCVTNSLRIVSELIEHNGWNVFLQKPCALWITLHAVSAHQTLLSGYIQRNLQGTRRCLEHHYLLFRLFILDVNHFLSKKNPSFPMFFVPYTEPFVEIFYKTYSLPPSNSSEFILRITVDSIKHKN